MKHAPATSKASKSNPPGLFAGAALDLSIPYTVTKLGAVTGNSGYSHSLEIRDRSSCPSYSHSFPVVWPTKESSLQELLCQSGTFPVQCDNTLYCWQNPHKHPMYGTALWSSSSEHALFNIQFAYSWSQKLLTLLFVQGRSAQAFVLHHYVKACGTFSDAFTDSGWPSSSGITHTQISVTTVLHCTPE